MMSEFKYQNDTLHAESVSLVRVAEEVGTPVYCYSTSALKTNYINFSRAFDGMDVLIAYSVKANSNQSVITTLSTCGAGADVVSEGELRRVLTAGVPGGRIVFSGVGKTETELLQGLNAKVHQFNLESKTQLESLSALAQRQNVTAQVAFRINPDVDAKTHDKIATGRKVDKFGVSIAEARDLYALAGNLPGIEVTGIDLHIGSQLTSLKPFREAFVYLAELVTVLRNDGHAIERLDLGGGLGIRYREEDPPTPSAYAGLVKELLGDLGCQLILEPGRFLVADAGVLLSRVIEVKYSEDRRFVIVDAAMNDLLRPALYDAWHPIDPVCKPPSNVERRTVEIVGPICESGDTLGHARAMSYLAPGDLIAIGATGAYGAVMSSSYNTRAPAPEVMVNGDEFAVVRPRVDLDTMIGQDKLPRWLGTSKQSVREQGIT